MSEHNVEKPEADEPAEGELEATPEERAAAEAFARALEHPNEVAPGSDAAFALALRASVGEAPSLPLDVAEQAIERAMREHGRARRVRVWGPILLAAAVLLVVVPAASRLDQWASPVPPPPRSDAVFTVPFEDAQRASERADRMSRARVRSYFEARMAQEGGS